MKPDQTRAGNQENTNVHVDRGTEQGGGKNNAEGGTVVADSVDSGRNREAGKKLQMNKTRELMLNPTAG